MNWSKTIDAIVGNNTDVPRVLWMFGCGRVIDMEVWTESSHREIIPFWQVNDSGETEQTGGVWLESWLWGSAQRPFIPLTGYRLECSSGETQNI